MPQQGSHKVIPATESIYNIEAEQALLGAILTDPKSFSLVDTFISGESFYINRHEWLWDAIKTLRESNEGVDYLTISDELRRNGKYEEYGNGAYLTQLINNTPTAAHVETYAHVVERYHTRRKMLTALDEAHVVIRDEEQTIDTALEKVDAIVEAVSSSRQLNSDVVSLSDKLSEYYDYVERVRGGEELQWGIPTGFTDIDNIIGGLNKSDLLVFAGRTGMGKTSWLLSTALNVARRNHPIVLFTMEMSALQIAQRLIAMEGGVTIQNLRTAEITDSDYTRILEVISRLSEMPIYIDDTPSLTPDEILQKSKRIQYQVGLTAIIVDYIQNLSAGNMYRNNRVQEISYISRSLKEMARELNITVLAAAQLSRAVELRGNKRPMLSDLRESGSIEQDADAVLFLYRDAYYNPDTEFPSMVEVNVAKHRHGETGMIYLHFNQNTTKFGNATKIDLGDFSEFL